MKLEKILCFVLILSQVSCGKETQTPTPIPIEISTKVPTPTPTVTSSPTPPPTETPLPTTTPAPQGWSGKYYPNTTFTAPHTFERLDDQISFNWGDTSPAPNIPSENFSIIWNKCTEFEEQYFTFTANTDGNTILEVYLNELLVLKTGPSPTEEHAMDFYAPSGTNCLTLNLTHTTGRAFVDFNFQPSVTRDPPKPGKSWDWKAKYYPNPTFTEPFAYERLDDEISFAWGDTNPAPNIPRDNFSVTWEKCTDIEFREYTFSFRTNENVRLDIIFNNIWILESKFDETEEKTDKFLGPAGNHCVLVKLTHTTGDASVEFDFE